MKIEPKIISILAAGTVDENTYYLPQEQLDRKTYEAVNKCLVNLGGKWNRKAKGHVFDYDPEDALSNLIITGETTDSKKLFQFFPTPRELAEQMCDMAELNVHHNTMEPSCGKGDLADVIYERTGSVFCVELNKDMEKYLKEKPYGYIIEDFLSLMPGQVIEFDRIVMNPPFSKQQDIDHIYRAFDLLKSGGILVSVVSPSPFFRENKKSVEFREFLAENNASVVDVPEGTFAESGTMIRTKIIKIKK